MILASFAFFFVILGATNLDVSPAEARLGLAAGEKVGPLGRFSDTGHPICGRRKSIPSQLLGRLEPFGRPTPAAVRWPAAPGRRHRRLDDRTEHGQDSGPAGRRALWDVLVWQSGTDRSIVGDRSGPDRGFGRRCGRSTGSLRRGSDSIAGLWTALAFLGGGWPPLLVIALAIIVIGKPDVKFSPALLLPPLATAILWSFWAIWTSSPEVWAASLTLPLTQKPAWTFGLQVLAVGLPWSPFAILLLSGRYGRDGMPTAGRG